MFNSQPEVFRLPLLRWRTSHALSAYEEVVQWERETTITRPVVGSIDLWLLGHAFSTPAHENLSWYVHPFLAHAAIQIAIVPCQIDVSSSFISSFPLLPIYIGPTILSLPPFRRILSSSTLLHTLNLFPLLSPPLCLFSGKLASTLHQSHSLCMQKASRSEVKA